MAYTATSLADIANTFERQADVLRRRSEHESTQRGKRACIIQAQTWMAAADILRTTELVGPA